MTDQEKIEQLVSKLTEWSKAYYIDADPVATDQEYDEALSELRRLEQSKPELVSSDSPTQKVQGGLTKGTKTVNHPSAMLSIFTETDISDKGVSKFLDRVKSELKTTSEIDYCLEQKIDGLSLGLIYKFGKLVQAGTRGNGLVGEDVLHNALTIDDIPKELPEGVPELLEIRGEVYMAKADFDNLNTQRSSKGLKTFMNPRNAAAGALRVTLDKGEIKRPLRFLAYYASSYTYHWKNKPETQSDLLLYLSKIGFQTAPPVVAMSVDEMMRYKQSVSDIRNKLPYDIDGVVYKVNRFEHQEELGYRTSEPRWCIAHKFPAQEVRTKIEDIIVQVGRTGKLTPVAVLTPVLVGGVMVSRATLHNLFEIRRKHVRIGDEVFIRRAGDVIPEVVSRTRDQRENYLPNFRMPYRCPACQSGLVNRKKGETDHYCTAGLTCPAQLKRALEHFASRDAMDIKGLGPSLISELVDNGTLKTVLDIYKLDGEGKSWENIHNAIEVSRYTSLWRALYSLGIPNVGRTVSKALTTVYGDPEALCLVKREDILSMSEMGPTIADSFTTFFSNPSSVKLFQDLLKELTLAEIPKIKTDWSKIPSALLQLKDVDLKGKKIVLTGTINGIPRHELGQFLEQQGAKISGSVSSSTDYLIAGDAAGSKLDKAESLGIPIYRAGV